MTQPDRQPWWKSAVCYEVYVRSFADADGDGVGDLPGIRAKLPYLRELGVDAVWLTPFYPSPGHDHGYDVADYVDVDPQFGTLADFDALVEEAHRLGLRVVVDVVPNHSSSDHRWFRNAVADPSHPDRRKYVFRDPAPDGGPPNNWVSVFGGSAWTPDPGGSGQWYLHLFAPEQPDFDWRNPEVADEFDGILRFWLDRGVDGFRIDVAHGLLKDAHFRDNPVLADPPPGATPFESMERRHTFDQEEVHDVWRRWRRLADAYAEDRALVGEVFLWDPARVARYVRPDELHLAFNFFLLGQQWDAAKMRFAVEATIKELDAVGATPTWVLSNHDVVRHATRYGGGAEGERRARAAALLLLTLPGTAFLYQGEELGLEEVDVPPEHCQDPVHRNGGTRPGRDGCRVPVPWTAEGGPGYGFTTGQPWLPTPEGWGRRAVDVQEADPGSMLSLYRWALATRREQPALHGGTLTWLAAPPDCLAFERESGGARLVCAVNAADTPAELEVEGEVVLASDPGVRRSGARLVLPPDTAAWVSRAS